LGGLPAFYRMAAHLAELHVDGEDNSVGFFINAVL